MEKTNVPRNHSPAMRPGFRSTSILTPFVSRPRQARDRRANNGYWERHLCGRAIPCDTRSLARRVICGEVRAHVFGSRLSRDAQPDQ
jgi:hypothetical protein